MSLLKETHFWKTSKRSRGVGLWVRVLFADLKQEQIGSDLVYK